MKTNPKITSKLAALELFTMEELKPIWQKHFNRHPARYQRDYMARRIAYQIQILAYGGLQKTIRNKLKRLAQADQVPNCESGLPTPGTRLMRVYKGQRLHVTVLADGYEFHGNRYKSLSSIATELVGSRTSGPKFFGLIDDGDGR